MHNRSASPGRSVARLVVSLGCACALALTGVTACSSEASTAADASVVEGGSPVDATVGTDSGPADTGGPDARGPDAGDCTSIANTGPVVSKTSHPEPPPAMTGGTIADGRYHLTAMDKYNGKSGSNTHQETWVFAGGKLEVVSTQSDKPGVVVRASGAYAAAGTTVTATFACPSSLTLTNAYKATPTEIRTVNADDPNEIHTLTLQP